MIETSKEERNALMDFYRSFNGPSWRLNDNWGEGDPCLNHWFGVMCNVKAQIIGLHYFENRLNGTFTSTFKDLKYLKHLTICNGELEYENSTNVNMNVVKGSLAFIWNNVNLEELNMQWVMLGSVIENEIINLYKLRNLNLAYNRLVGAITDSPMWSRFT